MSTLNVQLQRLKSFENGEKVARKMMQLWDFGLDPGNEHLVPSVERVMGMIVFGEEKLLNRTVLDISQNKVLEPLFEAMRESTDEEWAEAKRDFGVLPMVGTDTERLLADASGLVRDRGFYEWVLGEKQIEPRGVEELIDRTRVIKDSKEY